MAKIKRTVQNHDKMPFTPMGCLESKRGTSTVKDIEELELSYCQWEHKMHNYFGR